MNARPSAAPQHSALLATSLWLTPEPEHALLRHLTPLASFDDTVVGMVGRDIGSGEVTLEDLAEYPFVLEVRNKPGRYRIRDDMRRVLLNTWWEGQPSGTVPDDLSRFCERLAGRLERIRGTDPAEVLGLRLFADPPHALEEWERLYAEADMRFDLVRCQSLIRMLGWVATVSPEVDAVREDHETYLAARGLWTDEWYRTGPFVLPATSREVFDSLLDGDRGRVLELQGFGGYGKTMHLRWLIARRCVPAGARIPCARVDFDAVDLLAATREPYLVLLELADQLDRQLSGDAFGKLVRTYATDRARLHRRRPEAAARPPDVRDSDDANARSASAEEVQRRFYARLAEMPPDKPVLLVLDTLEVALHLPDTPRGPAVKPLLEALAKAARAKSVRLVLAGRYEIPQDIRKLFADWCKPFSLPKFTHDDARRYLVEKRRVEREDHVTAAIEASEDVPFSLALLADLIEEDPAISPDKIAEYRGAEYAYLIEKVVKRISELPVRWVLRYAAVPRRFDYEFVRDVIWPRVREGMSETGDLDHPADDDLPQEDRKDAWPVGQAPAADEQTVRQVWNQVRRYASGSSWLSTDSLDPHALRLQTEVVRPLRELLRREAHLPGASCRRVGVLSPSRGEGRCPERRIPAGGGIPPLPVRGRGREPLVGGADPDRDRTRGPPGAGRRAGPSPGIHRPGRLAGSPGRRRHVRAGADTATGPAGVLHRERRAGYPASAVAAAASPLAGRQRRPRSPGEPSRQGAVPAGGSRWPARQWPWARACRRTSAGKCVPCSKNGALLRVSGSGWPCSTLTGLSAQDPLTPTEACGTPGAWNRTRWKSATSGRYSRLRARTVPAGTGRVR